MSTVDHVPTNETEAKRIRTWGGDISSGSEEGGPLKIYKRGQAQPGLMVTRCLGASECQRLGVIYEPELSESELGPADRAIVMATGGLWDQMSSEDVAEYLQSEYRPLRDDMACLTGSNGVDPKEMSSKLIKTA